MDNRWLEFTAAIAAGDDQGAELASSRLTVAHQPQLLALLNDAGDNRWWAIRALALVGNGKALSPVARMLEDQDPAIRAVAALALGHLAQRYPDEAGPLLPTLGKRFADADGFVRQQAVEGMALAGVAALPALEVLLNRSNDDAVRVRAAATLRHIRDIRCARLLFPLLNDANHLVHTYAFEALEDLGLLDNLLLAR